MKKSFFFLAVILIAASFIGHKTQAQHYKLRQVNSMAGMKIESTIYVKGMRKRTESAGMMGMSGSTTILQCDLQRTIKINDKKKLYYIEPFAKDEDEIVQEDEKLPVKKNPVTTQQKGGIIHMWYNIYDTVDRKKLYGFNARHVWTFQKIKPSPDACSMKDSIIMRTDGWYIDLPQFNCPVRYRPATASPGKVQLDCKDKFVVRRRGKGKLGFPLSETTKMQLGNASSEFETSIETLEFSTEKLDSMLFEIPLGYTETANEDDLQDKMDANEMLRQMKNRNKDIVPDKTIPNEQKKTGMIRVGVYEPTGDAQLAFIDLQKHIVTTLTEDKVEAVAVTSEAEAKKNNCDYTLSSNFLKVKQGNKVSGLLKAMKNADPSAASSYSIEANLKLVKLSDAVTRLDQKVDGKFDGKIDEAAAKAMDKGCQEVLKTLKQ